MLVKEFGFGGAFTHDYVPRRDIAAPIMKQVPAKMKVIPLPMSLAPRYNEYFQTYRKLMGLK